MSSGGGTPSRPDWIVPALRTALEITLIVMCTAFLVLKLESGLVAGLVVVLGTLGVVLVLFWSIKEHIVAWIRYASKLSRRRQRSRQ